MEKVTNRQYIIDALNDDIDDGGASEEAVIFYHIACPHSASSKKAKCYGESAISREMCVACKLEWLETEYE